MGVCPKPFLSSVFLSFLTFPKLNYFIKAGDEETACSLPPSHSLLSLKRVLQGAIHKVRNHAWSTLTMHHMYNIYIISYITCKERYTRLEIMSEALCPIMIFHWWKRNGERTKQLIIRHFLTVKFETLMFSSTTEFSFLLTLWFLQVQQKKTKQTISWEVRIGFERFPKDFLSPRSELSFQLVLGSQANERKK